MVVDGLRLAVRAWPVERVAVPFLLVHGLASNARLWDGVAAALAAAGHPAVAVDLRGHGASDKPDDGYDVVTVAADVAALVAALGLERPIVAGQSWGGNVVLELARRSPETVRGIVCVDGGWIELRSQFPSWEACADVLAPPPLEGRRAVDVEFMLRAAHPAWPAVGIAATMANFEVRADGTVAPWLTRERHMRVLRGLWDHRPSSAYPDVRVPVLLVPADDGTAWSASKGPAVTAAAAALPASRTHWFRGDHDVHAQFPDDLAAIMLDAVRDGFFS